MRGQSHCRWEARRFPLVGKYDGKGMKYLNTIISGFLSKLVSLGSILSSLKARQGVICLFMFSVFFFKPIVEEYLSSTTCIGLWLYMWWIPKFYYMFWIWAWRLGNWFNGCNYFQLWYHMWRWMKLSCDLICFFC